LGHDLFVEGPTAGADRRKRTRRLAAAGGIATALAGFLGLLARDDLDVSLLVVGVVVGLVVLAVLLYVAKLQRAGRTDERSNAVIVFGLAGLVITGALIWSAFR